MSEEFHAKLETTAKSKRLEKKEKYFSRFKRRQWEDRNPNDEKRIKKDDSSEDRIKRRKCCLLMGYSGVDYFGMQRNPDMKTIEEDLLSAMLKRKWINDEMYQKAQLMQFQRAARTDKGVSAARQCISLKLPDGLDYNELNSELPECIRVFSLKRVTKGFNSKEQCNARTYTYTLPTLAFAHHSEDTKMDEYRAPTEKLQEVNGVLKQFEGTRNFHNFTSKKNFIDPSSKRYIISFTCSPYFLSPQGVEFATIEIKGQSFMLHQIRKMIGLTLAVVRGHTDLATIERSFTADRLDIPMAPGLGLVLDQVHYDRYNQRYGADGMHEALTWVDEDPVIQEFIKKYIHPTIIETEIRESAMKQWVETLGRHSYDLRSENGDEDNSKDLEDDSGKNSDDEESEKDKINS